MPTPCRLNRQAAFTTAARVPHRLLEPISTHGAATGGNLLIQGDSLEARQARWAQQAAQRFAMREKRLSGLDVAAQIRQAAR